MPRGFLSPSPCAITPPVRRYSLNSKYHKLFGATAPRSRLTCRKEEDEETKKREREKETEFHETLGLTEIASPTLVEEGTYDVTGSRTCDSKIQAETFQEAVSGRRRMSISSADGVEGEAAPPLPKWLHDIVFKQAEIHEPGTIDQEQNALPPSTVTSDRDVHIRPERPLHLNYSYPAVNSSVSQPPLVSLYVDSRSGLPSQKLPYASSLPSSGPFTERSYPTPEGPPVSRATQTTSRFPVRGILRNPTISAMPCQQGADPDLAALGNRVRFSSPQEVLFCPAPSYSSSMPPVRHWAETAVSWTTSSTGLGPPDGCSTPRHYAAAKARHHSSPSDSIRQNFDPSRMSAHSDSYVPSPNPVRQRRPLNNRIQYFDRLDIFERPQELPRKTVPTPLAIAHQATPAPALSDDTKPKHEANGTNLRSKASAGPLKQAAEMYQNESDEVNLRPQILRKKQVRECRDVPQSGGTRSLSPRAPTQDRCSATPSPETSSGHQDTHHPLNKSRTRSAPSSIPNPTPNPSSPSPAPRQVRITDGAWNAYKIRNLTSPELKPVQTTTTINKKSNARGWTQILPADIIHDGSPESISEFSDDSVQRLFGADSKLSILEEEEEEARNHRPVKNVLSIEFDAQDRREETPFFSEEGGGDRGFEIWRDTY